MVVEELESVKNAMLSLNSRMIELIERVEECASEVKKLKGEHSEFLEFVLTKDRNKSVRLRNQSIKRDFEFLCLKYEVTPTEIRGKKRGIWLVDKRMMIAKELSEGHKTYSQPEIGKVMRRDHTSIGNLLRRYDKLKHKGEL